MNKSKNLNEQIKKLDTENAVMKIDLATTQQALDVTKDLNRKREALHERQDLERQIKYDRRIADLNEEITDLAQKQIDFSKDVEMQIKVAKLDKEFGQNLVSHLSRPGYNRYKDVQATKEVLSIILERGNNHMELLNTQLRQMEEKQDKTFVVLEKIKKLMPKTQEKATQTDHSFDPNTGKQARRKERKLRNQEAEDLRNKSPAEIKEELQNEIRDELVMLDILFAPNGVHALALRTYGQESKKLETTLYKRRMEEKLGQEVD